MSKVNLTLTIDQEVLRRARIRAVTEGTSVNAVVREQLERYAGLSAAEQGMAEFLALSATSVAGSGPGGRTWTRAELYDRPVLRER
jgi:plasmid stability protein